VTTAQTESRKTRTPRWRKWTVAVALILLALALLVAPIGGLFLKAKLQWMVSSHLNADLKIRHGFLYPALRVRWHGTRR
jgi:hypothetical protein